LTNVNNINAGQNTGIVNTLNSNGNAAPQGGLAGFISLLLTQIGMDGQPAQNMQGDAALTGMVEKIAATLNLDPADPASLTVIPQQIQGAGTDVASLNNIVTPTLTADLVSAQPQEDSVDGTHIAALLNGIEPGAEMPVIDTDTAEKTVARFPQLSQNLNGLTTEQSAALKQKIAAFLKSEGISDDAIEQYLISFDGKAADPAIPSAAAQEASPSLPLATQQQAKSPPAAAKPQPFSSPTSTPTLTGTEQEAGARGPSSEDARDAKDAVVKNPAKRASAAPDAAAQQAQAQVVKTPAQKLSSQTAALSIINELSSGDFGFDSNGNFNQGFGGNGDVGAGATGYIKDNKPIDASGFLNYMHAARGLSAKNTQMIAMQIQKNASMKIDTFTVQLEPADLGRLNIEMKFDSDGGMKAHLTADRPETLAMLQRDSHQLHRILNDAGIDTKEGSLTFDLRQQGQDNPLDRGDRGYDDRQTGGYDNGQDIINARIAVETAGYISQNGVDIRV
jgi:flagellar hook-length control protein FliK